MENNNPKDIAELVATSLEDFRKEMEAREQLSIRINMAGLSTLGVIMNRTVSSLGANMHELSKSMKIMSF